MQRRRDRWQVAPLVSNRLQTSWGYLAQFARETRKLKPRDIHRLVIPRQGFGISRHITGCALGLSVLLPPLGAEQTASVRVVTPTHRGEEKNSGKAICNRPNRGEACLFSAIRPYRCWRKRESLSGKGLGCDRRSYRNLDIQQSNVRGVVELRLAWRGAAGQSSWSAFASPGMSRYQRCSLPEQ